MMGWNGRSTAGTGWMFVGLALIVLVAVAALAVLAVFVVARTSGGRRSVDLVASRSSRPLAGVAMVAGLAAVLLTGTSVALAWTTSARQGGPGSTMAGINGATQMGSSASAASARSDCPAAKTAGTLVTFTARDMGNRSSMGNTGMRPMFFTPRAASVPAGSLTLTLINAGSRPHELLVLPLAAGKAAGQRSIGTDGKTAEADSLGEVAPVCPTDTGADGTVPGGISQITLTLAPGTYEIVCNRPGHYARGMYATLTVTG